MNIFFFVTIVINNTKNSILFFCLTVIFYKQYFKCILQILQLKTETYKKKIKKDKKKLLLANLLKQS